MGWFREAHRYGNWIFAVRESGNKKGKKKVKWRLIATVAPRLRKSLEEFSFKALEICPLVSCQHPNMGVLYSVLPKAMYEKLPSLDEIHCNSHKTIDLGELKNAEAVIKAAKEGFNAALKEGGTHHWFIRQLLMACQPVNKKLREPHPHHGERDVNYQRIPRYPDEVYVKGKRVYYLKDKSGGFYQQQTDGKWSPMRNPEKTNCFYWCDLEPHAKHSREPGFKEYVGDDSDEWLRIFNEVASYNDKQKSSLAEVSCHCTGKDGKRKKHQKMVLHCTKALEAIVHAINTFSEGKHHFAIIVDGRIVLVCCATISPRVIKKEKKIQRIDGFKFEFLIDVGDTKGEDATHGFAGVAIAVLELTDEVKNFLSIPKKDKRVLFVVLPTTEEAWKGAMFPKHFNINRDDLVEFYKTGSVTDAPRDNKERLIVDGMCWEGGLQTKVEEIGQLDVDWIKSFEDYFPCIVKLPRPKQECAEPQPLAAALQYSRDLRKRKERDSDAWLAARKVVKRPRVKKPTGFKEKVYELPKPKPKPKKKKQRKESTEERKERMKAFHAKRKKEKDGGDTSAPAPAPKKPRAAPASKKRKEHPLRAKVKEKKRRK